MSEEEKTRPVPPERALARTAESGQERMKRIRQLRGEIARLSPEDQAELGMIFSELETPAEKLERLAGSVKYLSHLAAEVSVNLYRKDPERFSQLLVEIRQTMADIETDLAIFSAAVETRYPKKTFMDRFIIALVALVRGVDQSTLTNTFGHHEGTRKALFAAKEELERLLNEQCARIGKVQEGVTEEQRQRLERKQREILGTDMHYQQLVARKREIEADNLASRLELSVPQLSPVASPRIHALCQKYGPDVTKGNLPSVIFTAQSLVQKEMDTIERAALDRAHDQLTNKTPGQ